MAKDPALLFYTSDFLTGTMTMSDEQVGKYIRLLCLQHQKIYLSESDLMFICKTYDKDIFDKFIKTEEGFYNKRLREEAERRANYCNSRKLNKIHKKNIRKSYVKHMETENETITITKDINKKGIKKEEKLIFPFETENFKNIWNQWLIYRKEIKKPYKSLRSEQAQLIELSKYSEQSAIEMLLQSIKNGWQGVFELKTNNYGKQKSNPKNTAEIIAEFDRLADEQYGKE